jgi:hypothetical protein
MIAQNYSFKFSGLVIFSLFCTTSLFAATCPPVATIQRIPGENRWVTSLPGWEGYFLAPTTGQGHSYRIARFSTASWVKTQDLADSLGFIQCDYIGNFAGSDDLDPSQAPQGQVEVIRFTQTKTRTATIPPHTPDQIAWNCTPTTRFPQTTCQCTLELEHCTFTTG